MPPKKKSEGAKTKKTQSEQRDKDASANGKLSSSGQVILSDQAVKHNVYMEEKQFEGEPNEETLMKLFANGDLRTINSMIAKLTTSSSEPLSKEYKDKMEEKITKQDQLIQSLSEQVKEYELKIADLESTRKDIVVQTPIRSPIKNREIQNTNRELTNELEKIGIIFDMLEVITGLRINNLQEDDEQIFFSLQHTSQNIVINYKLIVSKKINTEQTPEILYIPEFGNDNDSLKNFLPDYFFENITFPYDTLPQFYQKMKRALDKM